MRTVGLICTCTLGWLAVRSDIRTLTVPDRYQAGFLLLLTLAARPISCTLLWLRILSAAVFAAALLTAGQAGSLGGADIKLAFTLAYTLGLETATLIFMLASILFLVVHGVCPLLWCRLQTGRKRKRSPQPCRSPHACHPPSDDCAAPEAFFPFLAAAAAPAVIRLWMADLPFGF